jgi:secreted Zn-dependent insulinase-like peptidase
MRQAQSLRYALTLILVLLAGSVSGAIQKPELDLREYRHLTLDNGLEVLLVSDDSSTLAGAGLVVARGSDSDPEEIPGLAHLLEHMVFAGSKRYPERGDFSDYVSSAGGAYNAYTAPDHTNFFFQVGADRLEEGLGRFADFLVAPSLDPEDVAGEVSVIQSEFEGRRSQEPWQMLSVFKREVNPDHPFSRFSLGNRAVFEKQSNKRLTERLKQWHRQAFVASNMSLVVLGPQSLETLAGWVRGHFKPLPAGADAPGESSGALPPLFDPAAVPMRVLFAGQGETDKLVFSFPVTPEHHLYKEKPFTFIARVLGSRQPGRLLPVLEERGWVSELAVSPRVQTSNYATFDVFMTLTEEGIKHREDIVQAFFAYLRQLADSNDLKSPYETYQRQAEEEFRHPRKLPVLSDLPRLALALQRYPAEEVLSGPRLMHRFDPDVIDAALKQLNPDRVLITDVGHHESLQRQDPVSHIHYGAQKVGDERLAAWKDTKAAPQFRIADDHNPFRAEEKKVHPRDEEAPDVPVALVDEPGIKLWHLQDGIFRSPRAVVSLALETDVASDGPKAGAINQLYALMLTEALNPLAEQGQDAGLQMRLARANQGLVLQVQGFSEKQPAFLRRILKTMAGVEVTPALVERGKARAQVQMDGLQQSQPLQRLMAELNAELNPGIGRPIHEMARIRELDWKALQSYHRRFWKQLQLRALVHGNYTTAQASKLGAMMSEAIPARLAPLETHLPPVALNENREKHLDDLPEGVALHYFPHTETDAESLASMLLATQMLHNTLFQRFRERQQGGYVALATPTQAFRQRGITALVQAPGEAPQSLVPALESSVQALISGLGELTPGLFNQYKQDVRQALGARKQSLPVYANYWWRTVSLHQKPVDEASQIEEALGPLSLEAFRRYCKETLVEGPLLRLLAG